MLYATYPAVQVSPLDPFQGQEQEAVAFCGEVVRCTGGLVLNRPED